MNRLLVVFIVICIGVYWVIDRGSGSERATIASTNALPITNLAESHSKWVEGIGYVEPRSELRRLTFKASGVILRCLVKNGDRVRQGELICKLDDSTISPVVAIAISKLDLARTKLCELEAGEHPSLIQERERSVDRLREQTRHLRSESERLDKTSAQGATSDQERSEASSKARQSEFAVQQEEALLIYLKNKVRLEQIDIAKAEISLAEAELKHAEQQLANTCLVAPFDGVVFKFLKREGEGVSPLMPPEPVVLFGDLEKLHVRAEVDERFARLVSVGQSAEIHGRNVSGQIYFGKVIEVEQVMGDKTVFSRSSSERKDLQVLQAVIEMDSNFTAPVGLQVDVRIKTN